MSTTMLRIKGMTCPNCAKAVEQKLLGTPGVSSVRVDLATGIAQVRYDEFVCGTNTLFAAVSDAGYQVSDVTVSVG